VSFLLPASPGGRGGRRGLVQPWQVRPLAFAAAAVLACAAVIVIVTDIAADYLWFRASGFAGVFATAYGVKWALGGVTGACFALATWTSACLARRLRPRQAVASPEQQALGPWRLALDARWRPLLAAAVAATGIVSGLAGASSWRTWLQFANRTPFGARDPQFHLDISFFVFVYPFLRLVLGYLFAAVLVSLAAAAAVHYVYGGLRLHPAGGHATAAARAHLLTLAGMFVLLKAAAYWLDRYGIDFSGHGVVATGASYADVSAVLPAKTVLAVISALCALLFFAGAASRATMLPAVGFGLLVLSAILLGGIYPAAVQQFIVRPSELARQSPYIRREIAATRSAYGIGGARMIAYPGVPSGPPAPSGAVRRAAGAGAAALPDLRVMDPGVASLAFQQLQRVEGFYTFPGVLGVDRYRIPGDGPAPQDVVVGVRGMAGPPPGQATWVNTHLVYTHGYGVVAAFAGSAQASGAPSFAESGIPPEGVLGSFQPRVYFGPGESTYVIAGARRGSPPAEFDYPGRGPGGQHSTTYRGGGGVPIGSLVSRLVYAVRLRDPSILLSAAVGRDSRLLYVRGPLERVATVAPFLTLDGDVYPVVAGGQILWVADGYTTTDFYPYSARYDAASAAAGGPVPTGPGAGQVNYIRDSVKAVVNAYTGAITLYAWDPGDPVLRTWMKAFPGLIRPRRDIPSSLLPHLRYPQDLFDIQRQVLARYHVTSPAAFYGGQDFWDVPAWPGAPGGAEPPAYLTMTMPGYRAPEFSLVTPFTQRGASGMAAYMAVDSDPESPGYGTIRVLDLPEGSTAAGPQQVQDAFQTDPQASAGLASLRRPGSRVIFGSLTVLPSGGGFLYTEPVYAEAPAAGNAGPYPALRGVLAFYGGRTGYGRTAQDALDQLGATPPAGGPGPAAPGAGPAVRDAAVRDDIAQAERYVALARAALNDGDVTACGRDIAAAREALSKARQAAGRP